MEKNKKISGIYSITNQETNKVYIGRALNIKSRWIEHKRDLAQNKHKNKALQEDYNNLGLDAFEFEVVEVSDPIAMNELEVEYICSNESNSYNATLTKEKIRWSLMSWAKSNGYSCKIDYKDDKCMGRKNPLVFALMVESSEGKFLLEMNNSAYPINQNYRKIKENFCTRMNYGLYEMNYSAQAMDEEDLSKLLSDISFRMIEYFGIRAIREEEKIKDGRK